jgi:hypothetical protein
MIEYFISHSCGSKLLNLLNLYLSLIIQCFLRNTTSISILHTIHYKPKDRGFETQRCEWFLLIPLILLVTLGPWVYSVSSKNEYQKQKNTSFWGVKRRPADNADNLTAICEPIV